jgi:hypothetical protein
LHRNDWQTVTEGYNLFGAFSLDFCALIWHAPTRMKRDARLTCADVLSKAKSMDDPSTAGPSAGGPPPRSASREERRMCAGKNRPIQIAAQGGRKLFDQKAKETFLEWFAATCNVKLSAAKAGVSYQTPFKHRMKDADFAAAWDCALQQGYARLEARLLQEATPAEGYDVRPGLDDPAVEDAFDPQLAIMILREHSRRLPGSPDKRKHFRTTAETATAKEVAEALRKRLKSFALRQADPGAEKKA